MTKCSLDLMENPYFEDLPDLRQIWPAPGRPAWAAPRAGGAAILAPSSDGAQATARLGEPFRGEPLGDAAPAPSGRPTVYSYGGSSGGGFGAARPGVVLAARAKFSRPGQPAGAKFKEAIPCGGSSRPAGPVDPEETAEDLARKERARDMREQVIAEMHRRKSSC